MNLWAMRIRQMARGSLAQTNGSGQLALHIDKFVDKLSDHDPAYKVKFNFLRYGVFRHYGAGRGYVIMNGIPVRGYRVRSVREISRKEFGTEASEMLKRGYTVKDVNAAKKVNEGDMRRARTALNWIDKHIEANVDGLADLVQRFYGDDALKQMLKNFDKLKIVKK